MLSTRSSFCLPGELLRAWRPRPRSRNKSRGLTGSWAFSLLILAAGAYLTQIFLAASHVAVMALGIVAYLGLRVLNSGLDGYVLPKASLLKEKDGCANLIASEMPKASSCRPQPRDACKESPKEEVKHLGRGAAVVAAAPKAHHARASAKKMGRKVRRGAEQHDAAVEQHSVATGMAAPQEVPSGAESTTASEKEDGTGGVECSKQERTTAAKQEASAKVPSSLPRVPVAKTVDAEAAVSDSLTKERTTTPKQVAVAEVPSGASSTTSLEKRGALEQSGTITTMQEASAEVAAGAPAARATKKADVAPAPDSFKKATTTRKQTKLMDIPSGASSTTASEKEDVAEPSDFQKQRRPVTRKQEASAQVASGVRSIPATKKVAASDSSKKERSTASKQIAVAEVASGASSTILLEKDGAAQTPDSSKHSGTVIAKQHNGTIATKQEALAEVPNGAPAAPVTHTVDAAVEVSPGDPSVPATITVDAAAASDCLKKEHTDASKQVEVVEVPSHVSSSTFSDKECAAETFKQNEIITTKQDPQAEVEVPSGASSTTASEKEDAAETADSSKECMTPPALSAAMPKEEEPEVDWDKVVESIILREEAKSTRQRPTEAPPGPQGSAAPGLPPPPEEAKSTRQRPTEAPPGPQGSAAPGLPPPPEELPPAPAATAPAVSAGEAESCNLLPITAAIAVATYEEDEDEEEDGKEEASVCAMDPPASLGNSDPGPDLPPGLAIPPRAATLVAPVLVPGSDPPAPPGLPPPPLLMAKPAVAEELASAYENAVEKDATGEDGAEGSASLLPHVGRVLQAAANGQLYVEKVEGDHPLLKSSGRGLMADAAPFEPAAVPQEETWDALEGQDEWQQMEVAAMWQQWWAAAAAAGYDTPGAQLCEGFDAAACSFPAGLPGCHPSMEDPTMCGPDASYTGMCDPAMWGDAYHCSNEYWNCQAAPCEEEEEQRLAY